MFGAEAAHIINSALQKGFVSISELAYVWILQNACEVPMGKQWY